MAGAVGARHARGWSGGAGRGDGRLAVVLPLPRATAGAGAIGLPRRPARGAVAIRARRRQERVGLVVGGIVVAFVLGLLSLSQTVKVSATGYDVDRMLQERAALQDRERALVSEINRLGREPAVRRDGLGAGLGQLAVPLIIPAR
jgi:hypothetical protein